MCAYAEHPSGPSLPEIIDDIQGTGQTLTLYNVTACRDVVGLIADHFDVTSVAVKHGATDDGTPENFAVLEEEGEFLAACDVDQLGAAVDPGRALDFGGSPSFDYPDLLHEVDQSVFSEYGKRRMILASRDIEKRAWDHRAPALHVGFQEFSRLRTQMDLYRRLTDKLTVHLYGAPDWEPPLDNVELHGYETDEIRDHWFVVYESGGRREPGPCSILAQEREPNVYAGFWTGRRAIADQILDCLRVEYPANAPFGASGADE